MRVIKPRTVKLKKVKPKRIIILGAAGRDFHNFNVFFRDNYEYVVVCFTANQIPNIHGRKYPKELSGRFYPHGIPVHPEEALPELIKKYRADVVVFAYSDVSHAEVMHRASIANACGADFWLMGPNTTMLRSSRRVISICAVRTGCGKSQTTRKVCDILDELGKKYVVIRHPMPYGDLRAQEVQRFSRHSDMDRYNCTIEEREEYEPHLNKGRIVYAGIDYEKILRMAEEEADVIVWDGGNNDFPFFYPDIHIVLTDPLRPGHEMMYHPGEANLRMADVIIINKEAVAKESGIRMVKRNIERANPLAVVVDAESEITVERPGLIKGKRVLVVEDGPTLTHGGMKFGAGTVAAMRFGARIVNPRPYAIGSIKEMYRKYRIGRVLPAMGYGPEQIKELERMINSVKCDVVIIATPIRLQRVIKINKPTVNISYELKEIEPRLKQYIKTALGGH